MEIPSYFAIRNKKTKRFITGSDFNYSPPRSIMSDELHPPMLFTTLNLKSEILRRKINLKYYEIVSVTVNPYYVLKEITETWKDDLL